jgi:hypothetical protein
MSFVTVCCLRYSYSLLATQFIIGLAIEVIWVQNVDVEEVVIHDLSTYYEF